MKIKQSNGNYREKNMVLKNPAEILQEKFPGVYIKTFKILKVRLKSMIL